MLKLLEETVNSALDKRIERCKETTRHIWKQLSQFIFKGTFLEKKQRHKGTKETQIFFDKFASSICFDATLSKLMSRSLITTIHITPSFACIYFSFYGKMRLTLRNLMSKSICVCLCWDFVRALPNKNRVRDQDYPLLQRYINPLLF